MMEEITAFDEIGHSGFDCQLDLADDSIIKSEVH
jgi:hypothetical protein